MSITVSKTFSTEAEAIAWLNGGTAAPTTSKTKADGEDKPAKQAKSSKPKVSQEEMQAALTKVKDGLGVPAAKAIIKEVGGVAKMDDIPEAKYEAVFKACEEKLNEETSSEEEDEGGI